MLKIKNVICKKGDFTLRVDNLELPKTGVVSILGPNGSGKTTLGECITKLAKYSGYIGIQNRDLNDIKGFKIRGYIGASIDREYKDITLNIEDYRDLCSTNKEGLKSVS